MFKFTMVLILIASLQGFSKGYGQKINLSVQGARLKKVLNELERQTDYRFFYQDQIINQVPRLFSINANNDEINNVLSKLFNGTNITYSLREGKVIILTEKGSQAQTLITGTVVDEKGEALPGVSIKIKGTNTGTSTDVNGKFRISVPNENAVLVFSFMGFTPVEQAATKTDIRIVLKSSATSLSEVVVVGYGTQRRATVTGSVAKITSENIEERPITRVEQALQGQMAGVAVRNTSGSPGADIQVRVRGAASLTGSSDPLYVVDGVPLDNLSGINPADIESIDVLKDAASAAIYGSRGSNGVVFVTTKRGKKGAKPTISVSGYTALSNVERKVDVMTPDQWIDFNKKWYDRQWTINNPTQNPNASQEERLAFARATTRRLYGTRDSLALIRNTYGIYDPWWGTDRIEAIDWQDALFRNAPVNDLQINSTGSTENLSYAVSAGIFDQEGIVEGSSFRRYSFRANLDARINKRIKIGANLAPSLGVLKGPNVDGRDNAVARSLSFPGWVPAGAGKMAGADPYKFYDNWGTGPNNVSPYVQSVYNERNRNDIRLNTSLTTTVNILDGLDLNGLVGWNIRENRERGYSPTWIQGTWNQATPGQLSTSRYSTTSGYQLLTQATLNYTKKLGNHNLDGLLGISQDKSGNEYTEQSLTGFPNDKSWIFTKEKATTVNLNSVDADKFALISYFGRLQYNYNLKYLFSASFRYDGSSRFGPNKKWGFFPALSAGWLLKEEELFKNISWLSTAKLRASWGVAGNDRIGGANYVSSMGALNYPLGDLQAINNGYVVSNIAYSDLRWEKSDSYNLGIDFGAFNDRIFVTADAYYKKTSDLLLNTPISLSTGFSNMIRNVGNIDNKGFELGINTRNLVGAFKWNSNFNLSLNRNKITKLAGDNTDIRLGQGNTIIQRVGNPINSYYLLKATGVLRESDFDRVGNNWVAKVPVWSGQKPGDTKYEDISGDGRITSADYSVVGNYQPKFEYGFTNTFSFKRFDASVFIQGRVGGDLLSIGSRGWNRATSDPRWSYMEQWLTKAYWSEAEPGDGKVPAFFSAVTSEYDTNWMYDASYLRIKNISFGYTFPVKNTFLRSARVYTSLENVYMWDNYYPGFSPEGATQDNASADWGAYPQARTLSFGLSASF
ncbi:SusC/RagA family TonB-linked outer membrane protein [Desertivirga brevis]|uniref:SusC/RagA family TonB-linked outer membrane protein n=1 Tax=Desertivirga brevis TaxID=2810310 RepID=UPI001F61F439|nr:SusC/RagA family TonB-linked outer membrane protein [Pedobacter sp. SYSU D00873]